MQRLVLCLALFCTLGPLAAEAEIEPGAITDVAACRTLDSASCAPLGRVLAAGPAALPAVTAALAAEDVKTRQVASKLAGREELGSVQARRKALLVALADMPAPLRGETLAALAGLGGPEVVAVLLGTVRDPKAPARNRIYAANGLGLVPGPATRKALVAALDDAVPRVQEAAAANLGRLGDKDAVPALIDRALRELTAGYVRVAAITALGRLKDPRALGPAVILLGGSPVAVKEAAARALGALGDPLALPALLSVSSDRALSAGLVDALSAFKDKRAARGLASIAADPSRDKRQRLRALFGLGTSNDVDASQRVLAVLDDPDPELVSAAAETFGRLRALDVAHQLVPVLGHADPGVVKSALWALEQCTGQKGVADEAEWKVLVQRLQAENAARSRP